MDKNRQESLMRKIVIVLKNYLVTQFVLIIIITLAIWGILSILNVKYALILGVFTGVLSVVPNYGVIISSIVVALVAILDKAIFLPTLPSYVEGLAVIAILLIFNKLVDIFITPLFLGKTNNINPLLLTIVVILGTVLFGVPGAILSVPVVLVIKTILDHFH
jgi:predicted PurR-regulated permease PerM